MSGRVALLCLLIGHEFFEGVCRRPGCDWTPDELEYVGDDDDD